MILIRTIAVALFCAAMLGAAPPAGAETQPKSAVASAKLFALILRPGAAWKPGRAFAEQGLRDHFHYWMKLFRDGRIASAGPLGTDSGLVLLFARDLADAEAIMRADPAIQARIFTGDVRAYAPPMTNGKLLPETRTAR